MSDLIAFVRRCLDDDERVARAVPDHRGRRGELRWMQSDPERTPGLICDQLGNVVTYDEGSPSEAQAAHIARHDPARVLAEVAAKRAVLDEYDKVFRARQENSERAVELSQLGAPDAGAYANVKAHGWKLDGVLVGLNAAIGLLAQPYAGQPGWREEWRV